MGADGVDHVLGEAGVREPPGADGGVLGHGRVQLVVDVVEEARHRPLFLVLAEAFRVRAHGRLDGEHVFEQAFAFHVRAQERKRLVVVHRADLLTGRRFAASAWTLSARLILLARYADEFLERDDYPDDEYYETNRPYAPRDPVEHCTPP